MIKNSKIDEPMSEAALQCCRKCLKENFIKKHKACPFRSMSNEFCDEVENFDIALKLMQMEFADFCIQKELDKYGLSITAVEPQ